jgi:hypothetical protein
MYDEDTLRRAYLEDETARLMTENSNLFAFSNTRRPVYGSTALEPEVTLADLSEFDVNEAITELAAERGVTAADLAETVFMLTDEHDTAARAEAVLALANMDPDELLALAAKGKKKPLPLDDEDDENVHEEDDDLSDAQIEAMAEKQAENMGTGRRPKTRRGKGKATRKRGQSPLGSELPGGAPPGGAGPSGEGEGGSMAASARRALVRAGDGSLMTIALSEDQEWAEGEVLRLAQENPRVFSPGDLGGVQRAYPFDIYDVGARDDGDPTDPDGGNTAAIIARLQKEHPGVFGLDKPQSGNRKGRLASPYPRYRPERQTTEREVMTMPITNADAARWSNANMTAAQNFESRCTDPIESGKEVVLMAGQNTNSPARAFEGRITQETGSH